MTSRVDLRPAAREMARLLTHITDDQFGADRRTRVPEEVAALAAAWGTSRPGRA